MRSHNYEFAPFEILTLLGSIVLPVGLFAAAMQLGAATNVLPAPRPALDIDRTMLLHQAEASRCKHAAGILLIGDSSCLMDVSAPQLGAALPGGHRALNLGTLSYLDLSSYASILRQYLAVNPGGIRTIILLMHPEALRRAAPEEHYLEILEHYYAGTDYCEPSASRIECWMGGAIFKGRLQSRGVPIPLEGAYAQKYGFTSDLWDYLSRHDGSAIDPRKFDRSTARGNAEYQLSPRLERGSQTFRGVVPESVQIFVGITPVPESFVEANYRQRYPEMLNKWSAWLRAARALADLPPTMPDNLFASTTHLNEAGQKLYTEALSRSLIVSTKESPTEL